MTSDDNGSPLKWKVLTKKRQSCGHFVLDEYADAIAEAIIETFSG